MSIKAIIPAGVDAITLSARLHQWDFGQKLKIECAEMAPMIEVHFACPGMTEAEVRPCNAVGGKATVIIPDRCLEQSSNITAWIFEIDGTRGTTTKTITIPVVARPKPANGGAIPESFTDQYQELIAEVNASVEQLKQGDVVVGKALTADKATAADSARQAGHTPALAAHGSCAQNIQAEAEYVDEWDGDVTHLVPGSNGYQDLGKASKRFRKVYAKDAGFSGEVAAEKVVAEKVVSGCFNSSNFQPTNNWVHGGGGAIPGGILLVRPIDDESSDVSFGTVVMEMSGNESASGVFYDHVMEGELRPCRVFARRDDGGSYNLWREVFSDGAWRSTGFEVDNAFEYKYLSRYPVG